MGMRAQFVIPIFASILILSLSQSYALAGNTTIDAFSSSPTSIFFTVNDPDRISSLLFTLTNGNTSFFDNRCLSNNIQVSGSLLSFPVTVTVTDCQANPDVTVWLIDSTGATCIEGSCLPPDDDDDDDDEDDNDDDDEDDDEDDDDEEDEDD